MDSFHGAANNVEFSEVTTIKQRAPLSVLNVQSVSLGILLSFLAAAALTARQHCRLALLSRS